MRESAPIRSTRLFEVAPNRTNSRYPPDPISEREWEHDHGHDGDVEGDVDAVPNKLDYADDEDDECHVVGAHDVGDCHNGHVDRPWWKVLKKHSKTFCFWPFTHPYAVFLCQLFR